jgi:myo-inositol-1(or 4)-monophosphatase
LAPIDSKHGAPVRIDSGVQVVGPAELGRVALDAARAAAAVHKAHLGRTRVADWSLKGAADFVTYVDREAEAEALRVIDEVCPGDAVLAEEGSPAQAVDVAERLWIVDPLDGTTNYLHGYPEYCASVAVGFGGALLAGAVVSSATESEYSAAHGAGAWRNGERLYVSAIERLELALIGTGFPFKALDRLPAYQKQFAAVLRSSSGVRRAGSAALDLCHVAAGHFDGFWELSLAPWDIAAGALLVKEAGGVITRLEGGALLHGGGYLAGNPVIHDLLGELLRDAG